MSAERIRHKVGDVREDGFRFWSYNGIKENWLCPEAFERAKRSTRQWALDHIDEIVSSAKRKRHAVKGQKILELNKWFARATRHGAEIRRHLSRGRDVGDIAVRMRIPVSVVLAEKERISAELRTSGEIV